MQQNHEIMAPTYLMVSPIPNLCGMKAREPDDEVTGSQTGYKHPYSTDDTLDGAGERSSSFSRASLFECVQIRLGSPRDHRCVSNTGMPIRRLHGSV